MKNLLTILMAGAIMIIANSCSSQSSLVPGKATALLQTNEFTFMAEHANPTGYDVVNVLNSLPNSSASNILNLETGYTMVIKKDEINVDLPYFGNMYTPSFDNDKNSFRFTSKDFKLNKTEGKKGSSVYTIFMKDQQNINSVVLEVYNTGKAYLSIRANDRQAISYDGYITTNKMEKK